MEECRLCRQPKPLCRSHIIPEFFFRPMYDTRHRALEITRKPQNERFLQKGYREPLLCIDCEKLLCTYEVYFKQFWFGPLGLPTTIDNNARSVVVTGFDYDKFKLLHLSVLWRASVSSLSVFHQVHLGPYEEKYREMILHGNPGADNDFRIFASVMKLYNKPLHAVQEPTRSNIDGHTAYSFIFGGCNWFYAISPKLFSEETHNIKFLARPGSITLVTEEAVDHPHIQRFLLPSL